jgi:spore germination protein KC
MAVKTKSEFDVIQNTTNVNLFSPKMIQKVEQRVRQEIEERERLAFSKAQKKLNADIFGFAETFERAYPEVWKTKKNEWNEIFQTVRVSFHTEVNIERIGLATGKRKRGEEY